MRLFNGDSIEVLKSLEPCSIDAVVTDPPYGLGKCSPDEVSSCLIAWASGKTWQPKGSGFMGKSWDAWVPPPELWKEVFRVLKPGGHILAFAGSRTQDLMSISLRLAGFEVRDIIQWLYGSGFPKSHNIGKAIDKIQGNKRQVIGRNPNSREQSDKSNTLYKSGTVGKTDYITQGSSKYEGFGTALKPAYEPVILCRKPFKGSVAQNVLKHGTGAINIDGCRIETDDDLRRTQHRAGIWSQEKKTHTTGGDKGRWPSNVIINEKVSEDLKRYGKKTTGAKKKGGIRDDKLLNYVGKVKHINDWSMNQGYVSRYFYCAKASREEREAGFEKGESRKNIHPTVKPIDLMRYLCRLITPPGGIVLDPFLGSGSTGIGAGLEGFEFIGIEREKEYFEIAEARIKHWISTPLTYSRPVEEIKKGEQLSLF